MAAAPLIELIHDSTPVSPPLSAPDLARLEQLDERTRPAARQTVIDFAHPSRGLGHRHESAIRRPVDQTPGHPPGAQRERARGRPVDVRET